MAKGAMKKIDNRRMRRVLKGATEFFKRASGYKLARHFWGSGVRKHDVSSFRDYENGHE